MKRASYFLVMLIILFLLTELFAFAAISIVQKQWFTYAGPRATRARLTGGPATKKAAQRYDFIANLRKAEIDAQEAHDVRLSSFKIGQEQRPVIAVQPDSEIRYHAIPIGKDGTLSFGIATNPATWNKDGDGVEFEVLVSDDESELTSLYTRYIDPKHVAKDRKWLDEGVDLGRYAGEYVTIVFRVGSGPENDRIADIAGWSTPRVEYGQRPTLRVQYAHHAIHPFVGYVANRTSAQEQNSFHGFLVKTEPADKYRSLDELAKVITHPSENDMIIVISGGSVATLFGHHGTRALIRDLRRSSAYIDKNIIFIIVGQGGYKQPQQLMGLTYLLSQDAHIDLVINLDGFNDIVLAAEDNVPKGVSPFFPRNWYVKVDSLSSPGMMSIVGEIWHLRLLRRRSAKVFATHPADYSVTMNLVWMCIDNAIKSRISHNHIELKQFRPETTSYTASGPPYRYVDDDTLREDLADFWTRCSLQMQKLCAANNIAYYHFLQPNQYVANSKTMNTEERRRAFRDDHPYREHVEQGYPLLIDAGKYLANNAVIFHDLTMIFSDVDEPLYIDDCCHVNQLGNDILAINIAKAILDNREQ